MPISFTPIGIVGGNNVSAEDLDLNKPTSLHFGPDGQLYASQQNRSINAFTK